MKRRFVVTWLSMCAFVALFACVTVNVYFPEAEVRDLSEQIEQEVRRQAGEPLEPGTEPGAAGSDGQPQGEGPGASLFDTLLGVTPVYAQAGQVAAPEITNPAIRKIIESRAARLSQLRKYIDTGVIGENNKALVEVRDRNAVSDLRERAELERLARAENADREELYKEIAAAKNVDMAQLPKIRETYAETLRQYAKPGDWIQMPDGSWKQK